MSRKIYCRKCGVLKPMHPEDVAMGLRRRRTEIRAKKPEDHAISINGVKQPQIASLICDLCGNPIPDGQTAVAETFYRADQGEPAMWEHEYE